jgi:hypothetical protein
MRSRNRIFWANFGLSAFFSIFCHYLTKKFLNGPQINFGLAFDTWWILFEFAWKLQST